MLENVNEIPLPLNEYSFIQDRNYIKSLDRTNTILESNAREKVVMIYFEKLKQNEFKRKDLSGFNPSKPIEQTLNSIVNSQMYAELKHVPKGGNLHVHEDQSFNRRKLLEKIKANEEYDYLYICDKKSNVNCKITNVCNCTENFLTFIKNPSDAKENGWVKVKNSPKWTIDEILNKTTLIGILNNLDKKISPTDSSSRWRITDERRFFEIYSDLLAYNKTRFDYLKSFLDDALEENVQLIEFRRFNFNGLYYFDDRGNRIYLPINDEIDRILKFRNEFSHENPTFIDFSYILNGPRKSSQQDIQLDLDLAIQTHKHYPSLIKGYDLVNEEDQGHSLLFHSKALINGFKYSLLTQASTSNGSFNYYFHNGETNWPSDMMPSQFEDDRFVSNNIYDALVFNTRRIGHGLAYIKHPNLYGVLRERNIAIEICPASNQILGFF